jgi:glutamine---fructose-6-phosphate transaminase (isomerizing)
MCGIIGYVGQKPVLPILINGLKRLEYRGYDSAGIAIPNGEGFSRVRAVGKISVLSEKLQNFNRDAQSGIGHTRWSTHGGVTENNAHPHASCDKKLVLVHNGIIENYREIRQNLSSNHSFESQTDSEILAHLIESHYKGDIRKAVEKALCHVRGTYGLAVMHKDEPNKIIAARLGSPIALGVGEGEYYVASDSSPMLAYTKRIIFLDDKEIAEISLEGIQTFNLDDEPIEKCVEEIDWDDEKAQKQGYETFMLKEINEQPTVFLDAIRGRINVEEGTAHLGGINMTPGELRSIDRILLIACGTAMHAGMVAKYIFEKLSFIPTDVCIASEFRYSDPVIDENTLVFCISQSGETADTLAALREAKRKGAKVRGIVNVVGSTIARESDGGTYIHAGPELAVASTKAYTNMITILFLYALQLGRQRHLSLSEGEDLINELYDIPKKMKIVLSQSQKIAEIAKKYSKFKNFLFLGRGINYPVAMEGSLKLKEISYIHSEGISAGEMKHGTIALMGNEFPIFGIITNNRLYTKVRSNIEEIKVRNSPIILLATEGDPSVSELADDIIFVPETCELLEPLINVIPLQLFSYHIAELLDRDIDRPRHLAKSSTVE